jgi:thiol-disulfide isomerase/thioredoxin
VAGARRLRFGRLALPGGTCGLRARNAPGGHDRGGSARGARDRAARGGRARACGRAREAGPVHQLTVTDLDGNSVPLSKFAGRPMIIEIWATWCGPCRVNRNTIHRMKSEFPERLLVVGVSVDMPPSGGSAGDLVKKFLQSNEANEHEFLATAEFREFINQRSASNSIPKTLYVNSKGQVADLSEGVQGPQWLRGMAKNLK